MEETAKTEPFIYRTDGGIIVSRTRHSTPYDDAVQSYVDRLDSRRGAVFSSNYEYPGRYTRWDTAMIDPPLGITSKHRKVRIEAYNERGAVLLKPIADVLCHHEHIENFVSDEHLLTMNVKTPTGVVSEEMRSRAPTVFSVCLLYTSPSPRDA